MFFPEIKMSNFPFACFDKPRMRRAASGTAPGTKSLSDQSRPGAADRQGAVGNCATVGQIG